MDAIDFEWATEKAKGGRRCKSNGKSLSLSLTLSTSTSLNLNLLKQATAALERQEVPIGCVLVDASGRVVAKGSNRTNEKRDVRF